jgi:hypothetical protein
MARLRAKRFGEVRRVRSACGPHSQRWLSGRFATRPGKGGNTNREARTEKREHAISAQLKALDV